MKRNPPIPFSRSSKSRLRAFTLTEVMMAGLIFALTATSLTALFIQNIRFSKWQTNNIQVTNSSFGLLDQIKNMGPDTIWQCYQNPTTKTLSVTYIDPTDTTDGYKDAALNINEVDGVEINKVWNTINLRLGRLSTSPTIPVSYWVRIKRNKVTSGQTVLSDVIELTLIYRWKVGGSRHNTLGQLQIVFPAINGTFK